MPNRIFRDTPQPVELSEREQQVVRLLTHGLSNKEIAHDLQLTTKTVEYHLGKVFCKLQVSCRTQVALWARQQGLEQD